MASITKPHTFSSGTDAKSSEVNNNFDTIYNDYNGNITNANIAAGAAIAGSKLDLSAPGTIGGTTPGIATFTNVTATNITATTTAFTTCISKAFTGTQSSNANAIRLDTDATSSPLAYFNYNTLNDGVAVVSIRSSNTQVSALGQYRGLTSIGALTLGDNNVWFETNNQPIFKNGIPASDTDGTYIATASGTTGGTGSAGAGSQHVQITVGGVTYKVLHDGTV